ncbi:MAG: hypothetical protein R3F59_03370 [Myxococcota bacterium]
MPIRRCLATALLALLALGSCLPPDPAGGVELELWRRTPLGAERLRDGDWADEGDVVQLAVRSQGVRATILSVDGRGVVTEHLAPRSVPAGWVPLDHAFELDDAPGYERFLLLVGPTAALAAAGPEIAAGSPPPGVEIAARIELRKP